MAGVKPLTGQASKTYGTSEAALSRPGLIPWLSTSAPYCRGEQHPALRAPRRRPHLRGVFARWPTPDTENCHGLGFRDVAIENGQNVARS